jgi:hypothetical protein
MTRKHWLLLLAGLALGLLVSGRFALPAQDRPTTTNDKPIASPSERSDETPQDARHGTVLAEVPQAARSGGVSNDERGAQKAVNDVASTATLQEALLRPFRFPFSRPTSLAKVCAQLKESLKAAVVLDIAALDRKSVEPETTVQLELDGVRLKTGLKLLLDQVGLTYRIVAEDNLMIITDQEGSDDPAEKVWAELKAIHRDLHEVQDAVDEMRESLGIEGGGPRVRKPTMIEEMPEIIDEKPQKGPEKPGHAGEKREGAEAPAQGTRPIPSRVPLAAPRRGI